RSTGRHRPAGSGSGPAGPQPRSVEPPAVPRADPKGRKCRSRKDPCPPSCNAKLYAAPQHCSVYSVYTMTKPTRDKPSKDRPWLIRTYAGHSTAAKSNELYRKNLARGQTGLSVAFDLPTQTGYDSDHPLAKGEVGKVGVPISHLGDMRTLF